MEEKFEELKYYFTAKMSEQEENLTKVFNVLNDLRKEITKQIQNGIKSHCKHLESENQMLKHHVSEMKRLNVSNQNNHEEELEQYGRCLCLRIDGVPTKIPGHIPDGHFPDGLFPDGNFPDRHFPDQTHPRRTLPRPDTSPTDISPTRQMPDGHFPDHAHPRRTLSEPDKCTDISLTRCILQRTFPRPVKYLT